MTTPSAAAPADPVEPAPASRLALLPAIGVSASAFLLFALQLAGWGHLLLALSLLGAVLVSRELAKDLALIGIGITIVSTTSVVASVDWDRFLTIGTVLLLAVLVPVLPAASVTAAVRVCAPWPARVMPTLQPPSPRTVVVPITPVPSRSVTARPASAACSAAWATWSC